MRGSDAESGALFSYVDLDERIPERHPLRLIRGIVNDALASLDRDFDALYAGEGRPSIAPERLLRATLIQILFSIRSERQLMEQMQYNLLFRWFVGLGIDDAVWVPTVFSKNRDRLLNAEVARAFLAAILAHPKVAPLTSDEHFSVDGTLIEAWASMKSLQPREPGKGDGEEHGPPDDGAGGEPPPEPGDTARTPDTACHTETTETDMTAPIQKSRNAEVDFRGEKRSNATHVSTTDAEARLYRKGPGRPAQLCYMGHALMENRSGLAVDGAVSPADGHAERTQAAALIETHADRPGRITLGADKGYDAADFVNECRAMGVTPHVARKARNPAIDGRTTRHASYALSQKIRKRIEEIFGWGKSVGSLAKTMFRGAARVGAQFIFHLAGYNLSRLPRLLAA